MRTTIGPHRIPQNRCPINQNLPKNMQSCSAAPGETSPNHKAAQVHALCARCGCAHGISYAGAHTDPGSCPRSNESKCPHRFSAAEPWHDASRPSCTSAPWIPEPSRTQSNRNAPRAIKPNQHQNTPNVKTLRETYHHNHGPAIKLKHLGLIANSMKGATYHALNYWDIIIWFGCRHFISYMFCKLPIVCHHVYGHRTWHRT